MAEELTDWSAGVGTGGEFGSINGPALACIVLLFTSPVSVSSSVKGRDWSGLGFKYKTQTPLFACMADVMAEWLSEFFSALGSFFKLCHGAAIPPVGACLPLCLL